MRVRMESHSYEAKVHDIGCLVGYLVEIAGVHQVEDHRFANIVSLKMRDPHEIIAFGQQIVQEGVKALVKEEVANGHTSKEAATG